jgi:hypothetical protein
VIPQTNEIVKQARISISTCSKVDSKLKSSRMNKAALYILIIRTIHQEDVRIINTHSLNMRTLSIIKQTLPDMNGMIGSNVILVGNSNIQLLSIDRSTRQKTNQKPSEQNCIKLN